MPSQTKLKLCGRILNVFGNPLSQKDMLTPDPFKVQERFFSQGNFLALSLAPKILAKLRLLFWEYFLVLRLALTGSTFLGVLIFLNFLSFVSLNMLTISPNLVFHQPYPTPQLTLNFSLFRIPPQSIHSHVSFDTCNQIFKYQMIRNQFDFIDLFLNR